MAEKQVFEGRYDVGRIDGVEKCNRQFNILRDDIEKLKNELISNSGCFDYILKEINKENENINRLLLWNQKRLNLLVEIGNKSKKLNDKIHVLYEELFDIINLINENNIETPNKL